ncbi:GMP synthase - Glutamine amidotransferase domain- like protein [Stackebrandtia nassauensis DSM 44728]|uniref:GMP synthase-Glutamine amidotransferase domain-like protein n=2 Tax=Stackebrandtia TaxID=283810 RepID=D3Q8V7_STANL|nr:GMP synthase - Glutamine amidotransferase domain- like protein [Stackebrandtia nassauensis DSM 44728]
MVIENAPTWHLGRLETWLIDAGLEPEVLRPHTGDAIPERVDHHDALIALGGGRGAAWTPELTALLRTTVADRLPLLAFCSSARSLATSFGATTTPVESFNPGPRLIGRRDAAADDPLFGTAPMAIDVIRWRHETLTDLPPDARLLAATPDGEPEIFRIGDRAWGIQSHVEFDGAMVLGLDGDGELARRVDAVTEHLAETWRPIIDRFAALAQGRTASSPLPLLD